MLTIVKSFPATIKPPKSGRKKSHPIDEQVRNLVQTRFPNAKGEIKDLYWPSSRKEALECLDNFITYKMEAFGDYQDSISSKYPFVNHSLISSSINLGLITPKEVYEIILARIQPKEENINSLEGFIRQLIGWREFVKKFIATTKKTFRFQPLASSKKTTPGILYWSNWDSTCR